MAPTTKPSPNCVFCDAEVLNGPNHIADFGNWTLILNQYQFLLGACLLVLKTHKEGLSSISQPELLEAHRNLQLVEAALERAFSPDWFNYLQTNNSVRHFHFHILPRYERPVSFQGEEFIDENFHGMPVESPRLICAAARTELVERLQSGIKGHGP